MEVVRYIVVDLEGASRLSFDRLSDARDWADRLSQKDADLLSELLIERFNDDGQVGESQWANEFLTNLRESAMATPSPFALGASSPVRLTTDRPEAWVAAFGPAFQQAPQGSWFGMATSTAYAFSIYMKAPLILPASPERKWRQVHRKRSQEWRPEFGVLETSHDELPFDDHRARPFWRIDTHEVAIVVEKFEAQVVYPRLFPWNPQDDSDPTRRDSGGRAHLPPGAKKRKAPAGHRRGLAEHHVGLNRHP